MLWIVLLVATALLVYWWWDDRRRHRGAVDDARVQRTRKVDEGRSYWGSGS